MYIPATQSQGNFPDTPYPGPFLRRVRGFPWVMKNTRKCTESQMANKPQYLKNNDYWYLVFEIDLGFVIWCIYGEIENFHCIRLFPTDFYRNRFKSFLTPIAQRLQCFSSRSHCVREDLTFRPHSIRLCPRCDGRGRFLSESKCEAPSQHRRVEKCDSLPFTFGGRKENIKLVN